VGPITRRDWWLGVVLLTLALLAHAAIPRYEWHGGTSPYVPLTRIDRWTGHSEVGRFISGQWTPH
jgi:hypothetical protein